MAHPLMFDEDDPLLARVRGLALAFPDAAEKISHGHPAFFTTKVFGYYGGSVRTDGEWVSHRRSVIVLADPAERAALVEDERFFVPAYLGAYGWVGLDLDGGTDWDEVHELLDASYRLTAAKRLIKQLDGN